MALLNAARVDVLVYGAGAIGLYLGGRLAASGLTVHFVGRAPVVEALRREGLQVLELDGAATQVAPAQLSGSTDLSGAPRPDLVLLTVKSGATEGAAQALDAHLPPGTAVLSFQNGVENVARLARHAPHLRAIGGMVPYNVVQSAPNRVQRTSAGTLGAQRDGVSTAWAPRFADAGLPLALAEDFAAVQWGKLLLNLNNPLNAISGLPLRTQLLQRDWRGLLAALQEETLGLLDAAGIVPARVTPLPPRWLPGVLRLPTPLFRLAAARTLAIHPAARSSMYDDRAAGRPTEIDALCGAVLRLAQRLGRDAPRNRALVEALAALGPGEYRDAAWLRARLDA
jgi:2-dehydropantoate 2-reductase